MDGRVGAAASELQRAPSQPPGVSSTKKISFSFGSRNCVSTRGSNSLVASTSASLHSSVSSVRSSSFTVGSGSGRSGRSIARPCAAVAAPPPREVLSIFCSNDESGADTHSKATRQVLSFDKFSGWEEKAADGAVEAKGKVPLVIPCLHCLTPPRRANLRSEEAERTPAAEARGAAASSATAVGTAEEAAKATLSGRQEERVSAGGLAAPVEWTEAASAGGSDSPAGERGARAPPDRKAVAGEGASAEGDLCGDAEERKEEKGKKDTYGVHLPAACGEASAAVGAVPRDGVGAAAAEAGQKSGGQITTQQPQQERKTGSVQFGLIKRGAGARSAEPRSSASADGRGRETQATSAPTFLRRTAFGLFAGLRASLDAAGPGVLAAAAAACVNDADDLAAHALIAEAKNENAAAAAAAWGSAYAAQDAVPILARNAELAALRRKFRERMQLQQQQQRQRQQQQSEQTQKEVQHEQSLQQRQCRGRGAAVYKVADVCRGSSRSKAEKYTWGPAIADEKNARSCGRSGSCDVDQSSWEDATAGAGGYSGLAAGATASSVVAGAAAASAPAAGGDRGRKEVFVNGSVSEAGGDSQKQQQTTLSREEAEKELLRQELDLLPDAPQACSAAYTAVPVSEFGMAMLRGMGYDPAVAAAKTAAVDEEKKSSKKRTYARAGLGSEGEVERLWAEREKKLKEVAMKERKRKLEEMQNSRYYR